MNNKENAKQALIGFAEFAKGITGNQNLKIPDDIAKRYGINTDSEQESCKMTVKEDDNVRNSLMAIKVTQKQSCEEEDVAKAFQLGLAFGLEEKHSCEDCISRSEALSVFRPRGITDEVWKESDTYKKLTALPSVTPQPCEDEYIKVPKNALKYRTAGMVAYNAEWLKDHFDIERAVICGAQQPCEDCISRQAVNDLQKYRYNCGDTAITCISLNSINELPPVTPQTKPNIKALGEDIRICQKSITDKKVLIGFNMAVALCNKYLTERDVKEDDRK